MIARPEILEERLSNGLTVLLRESHDVPVASFWVFYRVGSRNEIPGMTGLSHWVEHMQFKGTPSLAKGAIFGEVSRNGGTLNAFTSYDWTTYFETLPADRIGLAIRIEADRMANSLFDPAETESERTVILSERQGAENRPGYFLNEEMLGTAFHHHPYGHSIIGYEHDLRRITRDELYAHYRRFYVPNNAVIAASGDFDAAVLLQEIAQHFGAIPAGDPPPPVIAAEPPQRGERRVTLRRPAPTAYVRMGYRAPAASHPDTAALLVADAILSGAKPMGLGGGGNLGRSARLYRALVATGIARSAGSDFDLTIDPFLLSLSASALPGGDPAQIEAVMDETIARFAESAPADTEVARAIKQVKAQLVYSGEGVSNQAFWLGQMAIVDHWERTLTLIDELEAVRPDDIARVARQYLVPEQRTVGVLIPTEQTGGGSGGDGSASFHRAAWSDGHPLPAGAINNGEPNERGFRRIELPNGIVIVGQAQPDDPAISLQFRFNAGAAQDPDGQHGLAHLTGRMLVRGSAGKTFEQLNDLTDGLGALIGSSAGLTSTTLSVKCLAEDLPTMLDLAADSVRRPDFPDEELEKISKETLGAIREQADSTGAMAERAMRELLFPVGHPGRRSSLGEPESVSALNRDHLVMFHRQNYGPQVLTIGVAGGISSIEHFASEIAARFGDWDASATRPDDLPPATPVTGLQREQRQINGKSQADIAIGLPAIPRNHADYYPLNLGDLVLGRLGLMGRLGAEVRDKQGLAYYVYSGISAGRVGGLWTARAGVAPESVERTIASIRAELERLQESGITDSELADAQSYLTGSLPLGLERNDGLVDLLLSIEHFQLGLDFLERYPALINAVTTEAVLKAVRAHLDAENLAIGIAGPA